MLHCLTPRFSRTQAVPFSGLEDPGSPSERIASSFTGTASRLTWRPCQVHRELEYTDIWWDLRYEMIWHDIQWYDCVPIAWTMFKVLCSTWNIHNRLDFVQKMTSSLWIVLNVLWLKIMRRDPSSCLIMFDLLLEWMFHCLIWRLHQSADWATCPYPIPLQNRRAPPLEAPQRSLRWQPHFLEQILCEIFGSDSGILIFGSVFVKRYSDVFVDL